ncbi:related to MSH4-meiosis-specific protein [Rhynchosporium graminicola]|uniref:DNA mismatch repair protein MSH3 n=1 Tax=Rhynchosporium graminicola TaxID=2792576 RepID=A0A1E1LJG0_9HELO|nr:related to MSH4-meiosis-specific protein [Rhynchosporium commune]
MPHSPRPLTSRSSDSTSNQLTGTISLSQELYASSGTPHGTRPSIARPSSTYLSRPGTARPSSGRRSRSRASSTIGGGDQQQIVCAVSEARGISPTVGLAFVNLTTGEAVLSQICDNQFYARTLNKLHVFDPTEILIVSTSGPPNTKSKMYSVMEENIVGSQIVTVDRKYWSEAAGLDYIEDLAFAEDVGAIKVAIGGNYFATCCFAAALKYIYLKWSLSFAFRSLRVKFQPSEGTMMIDLATIQSLELIQNLQNAKSKACLYGIMNHTVTPMGARLLRSNILQPSTQEGVLLQRYDAVEELSTKEDMFHQIREGSIRPIQDIEKLLSSLIIIPTVPDIQYSEQSINKVLMLKSFVYSISPIFEGLAGARSDLLCHIRDHFRPELLAPTMDFIRNVINDDVTYQKTPLDLRNQRTYASGVSGLLDVARQTFKETTEDVHQHVREINRAYPDLLSDAKNTVTLLMKYTERFNMVVETRYDNARRYYLRVSADDFEGRPVPDILINRSQNRSQKKGTIDCQTLDIVKFNHRIEGSHQEVVLMSDQTIQALIDDIRGEISVLFRVCESIAMLDMISSFVQLATTNDPQTEYKRPQITDCIAIAHCRHPIRERIHKEKFVPNDVYASELKRFQIITGCNMSGKSTYIRSIALLCVMAQVGSFVPAESAILPLISQLFGRVSMDDSIEANVSTFASEMRETAFILRNIDKHSLAIIDELGRGTSSRDGLAISLSIAEALVASGAFVFFATHFRELAQILQHKEGVVNMRLEVDLSEKDSMKMLYKIQNGYVQEQHYGLALARVVDLPPNVLEVAERVSGALEAQAAAKRQSSRSQALIKRRQLVRDLREQLQQAADGPLNDKALTSWLSRLQTEFIVRMDALDNDAGSDGEDERSLINENGEVSGEVQNNDDSIKETSTERASSEQ